jgi:alkylation response protein AidB-like acyl-CoA dehydrogenase
MDFRYTPEEEAFLKEVQDFIDESLPGGWLGIDPGPEEESRDDVYPLAREMWRKLGEKGWIGLTWPKDSGGKEASMWKEMLMLQELSYRGAPGIDTAIAEAELVLKFGTEEQKQRFIPPILRGEVKWVVGMSEPNAGSDTFNVQLSAVEQDDCFILNGQKIWSSGAHHADREVVFARTGPDKHMGVSVFLVDLRSPGISIRQIEQMTGIPAFCEVFFDNVRIPKEDLLGQKNGGVQILLFAFGAERTMGLFQIYNTKRYLEHVVQYCKDTYVDGQPLGKDPLIRNSLAQMAIELEVGCNLGDELTWQASRGEQTIKTSSQIKVHGARCIQRMAQLGQQVLGLYGPLNEDSKWVKLGGRYRHTYLSSVAISIAGGTSEVARNHIAGRFGLNLPKQV